ncbi:MAG TPA: redoxin domain-containing protein [Anaerolineales bacterium]|nr:redoxin domain-containing protein [Anaerolineales bacterium]
MKIGDAAPEFSLPDLTGRLHRLQDYRGRIVILNFWSCECPHAERTDLLLESWIASWGEDVVLLPIASNVNESTEALAAAASRRRLPVILVDQQHRVADLYEALTTPHVYLIDAQGLLRYSGAVDDVNFARRQPGRLFLQEAVQALRDGTSQPAPPTQPYGCIIVRHALE